MNTQTNRHCLLISCLLISTFLQIGCQPPESSSKPLGSGKTVKQQDGEQKDTAEQNKNDAATLPLDGSDGRQLALDRFRPKSMLKVKSHHLKRAKYPVVDVHTHPQIRWPGNRSEKLDEFVKVMDQQNIAVCVSLDGGLGDKLADHCQLLWKKHRDRFVIFTNIDWRGSGKKELPKTWDCHQANFPRRIVEQLKVAKQQGASGLKLFKQFGLGYRNPDGSLVKIDDSRWDPIWQACGELGLAVIIHTADPAAFFEPINNQNERWEELHRHRDWSFHGKKWPSRKELLDARNRVIARHSKTTFIGAHFANNPEDLATLGSWLDQYPNLQIEMASRIAELGRQPYTARKFFLKYADRIMFGTDGPRDRRRLMLHWRFLETYDENFPYSEKEFPPQGFWNIHGLGLPDEVLKKVYHENASRIIPGVKEKVERYRLLE